jgi:phosphoglycolate phosphatase
VSLAAPGFPSSGVSFGYNDIPIAELKPDRLIHHMRDLAAAVGELSVPQAGK